MFQETAEGKEEVSDAPDTSHCVDLNYNEDSGDKSQNSQKITNSTTDTLLNSGLDKFPEVFHASSLNNQSLEPMGKQRNVCFLELLHFNMLNERQKIVLLV